MKNNRYLGELRSNESSVRLWIADSSRSRYNQQISLQLDLKEVSKDYDEKDQEIFKSKQSKLIMSI